MPVAGESGDWTVGAACRDIPTDLFFPVAENDSRIIRAKLVCSRCVVQVDCLDEGLTGRVNGEYLKGIWGGTTYDQRILIRAMLGTTDLRDAVNS